LLFLLKKKIIDSSHIVGHLGQFIPDDEKKDYKPKVLRTKDTDITLYKSVGIAVQDIASAHAVYLESQSKNIGVVVKL